MRARAALHDAHRSREDDDGEISAVRVADNEGRREERREGRDVDLDHGLRGSCAGF